MEDPSASRVARPLCELGLDEEYCGLVLRGAVGLLEGTGLKLESGKARLYLSQLPGVRLDAGRVRFSPAVVLDYVDALRSHTSSPHGDETGDDASTQGPPWACLNWADAEHAEDPQLDIEMTGGMPCCGSTAPLQFPAAHIQSLAEDLAASLFMHFITGEYHCPGLRSDPFDMRYGNYCVGSPEYVLLDLAARKLFEGLFGRKRRWGYFLSMSKWPDRQAAHERTAGCWLQALAGAVHFRGSGQLSSDEIFSSEQVVIDRSIMRGAERLFRGLKWASSLDENLEVLEGGFRHGNFLEHPSTLVECREFYALRELFPATNLGQWNGSGRPTALGAAMNVVRQTLERNTFQRDPGEIRELRRTCTHGERGA